MNKKKNEEKLNQSFSKAMEMPALLFLGLALIIVFSVVFYLVFFGLRLYDHEGIKGKTPKNYNQAEINKLLVNPINPEDLVDIGDMTKDMKDKLNFNQQKLFN